MNLKSQMLSANQVESLIKDRVQHHRPFSLIRINDGENRALGYGIFVNERQLPRWFRYTGVDKPDESVRRALIQSIKDADMVGFPTQDNPVFRPLSEKILAYYKLKPRYICNGIINRFFIKNGGLKRIIRGQRVALVGLTIGEVAKKLESMGASIVAIEKVHGFKDLPRVLKRLANAPEYDIALVSAGIPAKIICTQLSKRYGKVALDMGHLPELLLYPTKRYGEVITDWLNKHRPTEEIKQPPSLRRQPKKATFTESTRLKPAVSAGLTSKESRRPKKPAQISNITKIKRIPVRVDLKPIRLKVRPRSVEKYIPPRQRSKRGQR